MIQLFSSKDIVELFDIPQRTLSEWVGKEIIKPVVKGKPGRGNPDEFGLMQTVGIGVAISMRDNERGCSLSYIKGIVRVFSTTKTSKLSHFFHSSPNKVYFGGFRDDYTTNDLFFLYEYPLFKDWVNVREVYQKIIKLCQIIS